MFKSRLLSMSCDLYLTCFLTKGSTLICCSPWFLWVLMLVSVRRNESSEVLEKQIYIYLLRILNSISCHNSFLIHNSSHAFHNPFNSVFFLSLWTINMGEKIKQKKIKSHQSCDILLKLNKYDWVWDGIVGGWYS